MVFANAASFVQDAAKKGAKGVAAARQATYGDAADACYDKMGRTCSDMHKHAVAARKATYGDAADACYETVGQTCAELPGNVAGTVGQAASMAIAARRSTYGDAADACYDAMGEKCTEIHENVAGAAEQAARDLQDLPGNAAEAAGQVATMTIAARRATYGDAADACYELAYDAVRNAADAMLRFVGGADEAPVLAGSGPSELFIAEVEKPEVGDLRSASTAVKRHTGISLTDDDQKERNIQLILAYTRETPLYKEMNLGLRANDKTALRKYAGYIRELRDAFAVHLPDAVVTPFSGTVRRGINVPNAAEVLSSYVIDEEYVWPSFTSTSTSAGFSGNVQFEIVCPQIPADHEGYAPANIKQFSAFPSEDEILFPPHMKLRVVNIQGSKVLMETTAFPSVWEMVEQGDWDGVGQWAEMNPDRVEVKGASKSLANTIAMSSSLGTVPESIRTIMGITPELCAKLGVEFVGAVGSLASFASGSLMKVASGAGSMLKGGYKGGN